MLETSICTCESRRTTTLLTALALTACLQILGLCSGGVDVKPPHVLSAASGKSLFLVAHETSRIAAGRRETAT